jgi:hypothetical protein
MNKTDKKIKDYLERAFKIRAMFLKEGQPYLTERLKSLTQDKLLAGKASNYQVVEIAKMIQKQEIANRGPIVQIDED